MAETPEVSFSIPQGLPDATILRASAQKMIALQEASEREEAIQTVFKLIDGVLAAPEDPKKRRVRKSNEVFHRKVGRHPPAVDFLRGAGFIDAPDPDAPSAEDVGLLLMPIAYISRITDAHHALAMVASEAGIAAPLLPKSGTFNPFQSNCQATDTTHRTAASDSWKSEADRVREEVKRKQTEIKDKIQQAPPVDMRPTAFWLAAGRRLDDVVRETAAMEGDRTTDNALLQQQISSAKATISGDNSKFTSADKKRLAELSRTRVYEVCILRVICPDKSVLQAQFRSGERGEAVMAAISGVLAPHVASSRWYIYQSPPLKRLQPKETLVAAGLTPGANMYLGFEGDKPGPPYLGDSLVAQLGPRPQDDPRGVNAPATFSGEAMGWGVGKRLGAAPPAATTASSTSASAKPQEVTSQDTAMQE